MSLAKKIKDVAEIHGEFLLRSGVTSNRYFDKYRFESDPAILNEVALAMVPLVPEGTEVLCGLEMGGIPIVTMLSQHTGLPAAFIRKEAKEYGTCKYAEGTDLAGKKLVFIEDVVSSGGALIDAADKLRADGLPIDTAICVIDRETGGKEKLAAQGIELLSVLTASEIDAV